MSQCGSLSQVTFPHTKWTNQLFGLKFGPLEGFPSPLSFRAMPEWDVVVTDLVMPACEYELHKKPGLLVLLPPLLTCRKETAASP